MILSRIVSRALDSFEGFRGAKSWPRKHNDGCTTANSRCPSGNEALILIMIAILHQSCRGVSWAFSVPHTRCKSQPY